MIPWHGLSVPFRSVALLCLRFDGGGAFSIFSVPIRRVGPSCRPTAFVLCSTRPVRGQQSLRIDHSPLAAPVRLPPGYGSMVFWGS
uniref:Putative secreted protein n=1 Tax=Anopheles darlingi TaxID=43151 RepID=A0A2M4D2T7_ANODA